MNSHRQAATISLVIHDITATSSTNDLFSFLVKRTHQIIETNEFQFNENLNATIDTIMKFKCNFKLNGKKEWKKKLIELKLIKDNGHHKAKVVGCFKIDLSEVQKKDTINATSKLYQTSLGILTLNYTLSYGEHIKSVSIDSINKSNHISFSGKKIKTHVKISNLSAYESSNDIITNLSDDNTDSKSDEIALLCENFDYQNIEKIAKIPVFAKKTADIFRDSIDFEGIQSVVKVLNRLISYNIQYKIYAGMSALYLLIAFENRLKSDDQTKQMLIDSLNEAFDFSLSDLRNEFGSDKSIRLSSEKINDKLRLYGSGEFFDFYIQSLEFAYASLYKKPKADLFFKAFHINDKTYVSIADHFEQEEDVKDCLSPVAEQITEHLLEAKI